MQEEEDRLQWQQARGKHHQQPPYNRQTTNVLLQLISRLSADEITRSRAFSTAVEQSKRPTATEQPKPEPSQPVRHFNTSRTLKTVNDSSTIDFAYLPDFDPDNTAASSTLMMRVPILPDNTSAPAFAPEAEIVSSPHIPDFENKDGEE